MSLLNAFKIIKNEGMKTFGHVVKEKLAEREDDNKRYYRIIKTTETGIKDLYKDQTETNFDLINVSAVKSIERLKEKIEASNGKYVAFVDSSFYFEADCLTMLTALSNNLKKSESFYDLFYADEDYLDENEKRVNPDFKPDYSVDSLYSYNYIGKGWFIRRELLIEVLDEYHKDNGDDINDWSLFKYQLLVAFSMKDIKVYHVNRVLVHNKNVEKIGHAYMKKMADFIKKEYKKKNIELEIITKNIENNDLNYKALNYLYYKTDKEKVSIIIPSKDNPELVKKCLVAIKKFTKYTNYNIVLVDNGSSKENRLKIEELVEESSLDIRYIYEKRDFNFSYMCNLGARHADGDYYLFLNDDVEIVKNNIPEGYDWLSVMLGFAKQDRIGSVGVKLLYPDGKHIQHLGIVNYEEAGFAHIYAREEDLKPLKQYRNRANINVLCVTAAAVLVSAKKFREVGGFLERLEVTHNDVELGLKLYEKGYDNLLVNAISLIHHESLTRGLDGESEEKSRRNMKERELTYKLHPDLKKRDPFYSEYLSQMEFNNSLNYSKIYDEDISSLKEISNKLDYKEDSGEIKAAISSVIIKDKLMIKGYAYSRDNTNRKTIKVRYILEAKERSYEAKANNKCDRMAHQRFGLEKHCNYAENYCNLSLTGIEPGEYTIKMIYNNRIVAKYDGVFIY